MSLFKHAGYQVHPPPPPPVALNWLKEQFEHYQNILDTNKFCVDNEKTGANVIIFALTKG